MNAYIRILLLGSLIQSAGAKIITLDEHSSIIARAMRATSRVVPTIDLGRVIRGCSPLALAGVYLIYTKPLDKIADMGVLAPFAMRIKDMVGGVSENFMTSEEERSRSCKYGIGYLLKNIGIKIDTEPFLKLSVGSLLTTQISEDATDLKRWCATQAGVIYEEMTQEYNIPENVALCSKDRSRYLYHLISTSACRGAHDGFVNFEVIKDLSEGCTAEDLEAIVRACHVIDPKVFEQVATYYAGRALVQKLLNPRTPVRVMVSPVNCSAKETVFGKVEIRERRHVLRDTTCDARTATSMVAWAGVAAAQLRSIPLSTIFMRESEARVQELMRDCLLDEAATGELRTRVHESVRQLLEEHRDALEVMTALLMEQWEISNAELEEIIAHKN